MRAVTQPVEIHCADVCQKVHVAHDQGRPGQLEERLNVRNAGGDKVAVAVGLGLSSWSG